MVFNHIWIFFLLCSLISYQADCSYIYYQGIKDVDFYQITNGVWWEYQTFNKENLNEPHDCLATKFYADSSKQTLTIIEDYVATTYGRDETIHTRREYTVGTRPNPNENGYLGSMYSEKGTKLIPTIYKVLGTDYKSWLVVYICSRSESFSSLLSYKTGHDFCVIRVTWEKSGTFVTRESYGHPKLRDPAYETINKI